MWWFEDTMATIQDGRLRSLNESSHHQKNGCCQRRRCLTTRCDSILWIPFNNFSR
ncbi:hypothetical protein IC582_004783 [Cucumis melo]